MDPLRSLTPGAPAATGLRAWLARNAFLFAVLGVISAMVLPIVAAVAFGMQRKREAYAVYMEDCRQHRRKSAESQRGADDVLLLPVPFPMR